MFLNLNKNKCFHSELEDAPDKPPTKLISIIIVISFVFVFICIAISFPAVDKLFAYKEAEVNLGMGNTGRLVYLSQQKNILSSYNKIDDKYYHMPIDEAINKVVETQGNINAYLENK